MMNHVFIILILVGILIGIGYSLHDAVKADTLEERIEMLKIRGKKITDEIVKMAETSVNICIGYIGLMALWLGIMKIADESGLVRIMVGFLRPVMVRLFPRVPPDHPAMGAMLMNIAANMVGLDNAATPLGLKAMRELQTLNAEKDIATNDMIMFMAINTSSVTLIPFSVMVWRSTTGSVNPQAILGPATLATTCSTIGGITAAYLLGRFIGKTKDYYNEYKAGKDITKLGQVEGQKKEKDLF